MENATLTLNPKVRFLSLVRPFMSVLPEVSAPERKGGLSGNSILDQGLALMV